MKDFVNIKTQSAPEIKKHGILVFAFGVPSTIWSNQTLAVVAARKAQQLGGAPIFTQLDIQFDPSWEMDVQYCNEVPGNPPRTMKIAREALFWANNLGLTDIWVAGARPHLTRIIRDINYLIQYTQSKITFHVCEETLVYWPEEFFCKDSTQPQVKSWFHFWPREIIGLLMPMFIYRRLSR